MLKTFTWFSLGLSILGTVADLGGAFAPGSASPDRETLAELALVAKVLGAQPDANPDAASAPRR